MQYIIQFCIILFISLVGEGLAALIPLPVPAGIYGLILMLGALMTRILKVEDVKEASSFLIEIMPLMFIPAAVGVLDLWTLLQPLLLPYGVMTVVSTIAVMALTGKTAQGIIRLEERRGK